MVDVGVEEDRVGDHTRTGAEHRVIAGDRQPGHDLLEAPRRRELGIGRREPTLVEGVEGRGQQDEKDEVARVLSYRTEKIPLHQRLGQQQSR